MKKSLIRMLAFAMSIAMVMGILVIVPVSTSAAEGNATVASPKQETYGDYVYGNGASLPERADVWDGSYATGFAAGDGSTEDPYQISNAAEFMYFRDTLLPQNSSKHFVLTNHIYLNDENYSQNNCLAVPAGTFSGVFDGRGYAIYNGYTAHGEGGTAHLAALFHTVSGTIKNLDIVGFSIQTDGDYGVCGLARIASGTIENCHVVNITASQYDGGKNIVAGLIGETKAGAKITDCSVSGEISSLYATVTDNMSVAGIVAFVNGSSTITGCRNYANVSGKMPANPETSTGCAGIVGNTSVGLTLKNCHNYGEITSKSSTPAGGILARAGAGNVAFEDCTNYGAVSSMANVGTGGILGFLFRWSVEGSVKITNTENYGSITADNSSGSPNGSNVGGLVGKTQNVKTLDVENSANHGDVYGNNTNAGGVIGFAYYTNSVICNGFINTGSIQASKCAGGVAGKHSPSSGTGVMTLDTVYIGGNITTTTAGNYVGTVTACYNVSGGTYNYTGTNVAHNATVTLGSAVQTEPKGYYIVDNSTGKTGPARKADCITDGTAQSALNTYATANNLTPWAKDKTGVPTLLTTLGISGSSMTLGGSMSLNMMLDEDALAGIDNITSVQFASLDESIGVKTVTEAGAEGYYKAPYSIAASNMAKALQLYVIVNIGAVEYKSTNILTYSVADYITRMYAKESTGEDVKTVLEAMVGYGVAAEANAYGTSTLASVATGIASPAWTEGFNHHISDHYDGATLANYIESIGASLDGGITLEFTPKAGVTSMTVSGGGNGIDGTYGAVDGVITLFGVHAAMVRTRLTFTFGDTSVPFTVGNYLETRRNGEEQTLVEATILYMVAVRAYALNQTPVGPAPTVTHTVTFDSAGGSAVTAQTITDGRSAVAPTAPTRDGYTFVAWTLKGVDYDFSSPVTGDITLVARWKTQGPYTVTYQDADGSTLSTESVARNGTATAPADPEREGYTFTGWTWNGNTYDFTTPVTEDITLVASYEQNETPPVVPSVTHVVTFQHANGTGESTPVSVPDGYTTTAAPAPTYNGYTFSHWADAEGNAYNFAAPVTEDITLKAVYTRDESISIPAHTTGSIVINPSHIEFWAGNDLALQLNIQATVTYNTSSVTTDVHYEGMDVTFYSDNPNVVAVSKDGTLTAVGLGTARVWAVIHQGGTQVHGSTDYVNYDPFVIHDGTVLFPTVVTIIEQPAYLQLAASKPEDQQVQLPTSSINRIDKNDFLSKPTGEYGSANIALWYNDATAAMSITADDNLTGDFAQWSEWAETYGIPVSLMVPTGSYANNSSLWISMTARGNEAQPHSHSHYAVEFYTSSYITSAQAWNDSYLSKVEFEEATGIQALVLAYPCGYNAAFNNILYIGGRGVNGLAVYVNNIDYNSVDWQEVPTTAEQIAKLFDPTVTSDRFYTYGGWLNFLEHGIGGREATYEKFLPLAKEYVDSGELWAAVFSAICQYGQERDTASILNMNAGADVITFTLTDKMNDMLFDHALTVKIKVDSTWTAARAYQNGAECDTRIVTENGETYVYVNAVPDKGEVKVVRTSIENLTETENSISFTPVDLGGVDSSAMTLTFTVDGTVWTNPYAVQNGNLLTATLKTYGGKTTLTVPFTVGGGEVVIVPVTDQYAARDSLTMYEVWQGFVTPDGTKPVLISTPDDLVMFSEYVRGRGVTAGITFRLTNDIDMSAVESFLPIGWLATHEVPFSGIFDGAEHTISNLTINQPGMNYVGLFGYVNGGTITRLTLDNASVLGVNYVGGLVGRMTKGIINGVAFSGTVTANGIWRQSGSASRVGGLIGQVDSSTVKNCEINATVDAYASGKDALSHVLSSNGANAASYVGGVVGEVYYAFGQTTRSTLDNIIFNGDVTAHKAYDGLGAKYVGGFAGYVANATMTNITVNADVTGGTYVGGLLGYITHTNAWVASSCKNNSAVGTVTGDDYVGGLGGFIAANNQLSFTNCMVLVTVTAPESAEQVGAVIGSCPYTGSYDDTYFSHICYMEALNPGMVCNPGTVKTGTASYDTVEAALAKLNTYAGTNNLPAWRPVDGVPSASYFPVFTVTFLDKDGNVIEEQAVANTMDATLPEAPFLTGYEFTGWSVSHENITAHTTIQALYREVEVYTVIFVGKDGDILSTQEINTGRDAVAPEVPVIDGFAFTGWDVSFENVTSSLTITAQYREVTDGAVTMNVLQWQQNKKPSFTSDIMSGADVFLYTGNTQLTDTHIPDGWAFVQSANSANTPQYQAVLYNANKYTYNSAVMEMCYLKSTHLAENAMLAVPLFENATGKLFVMTIVVIKGNSVLKESTEVYNAMDEMMLEVVRLYSSAAGIIVSLQASTYSGASGNTGSNVGNSAYFTSMDNSTPFAEEYDLVCHYEAVTPKDTVYNTNREYATYLLTYMAEGQNAFVSNAETVEAAVAGTDVTVYYGLSSTITFDKDTSNH